VRPGGPQPTQCPNTWELKKKGDGHINKKGNGLEKKTTEKYTEKNRTKLISIPTLLFF
jgi:hypothetical protein